jgi:hypothetical protein
MIARRAAEKPGGNASADPISRGSSLRDTRVNDQTVLITMAATAARIS